MGKEADGQRAFVRFLGLGLHGWLRWRRGEERRGYPLFCLSLAGLGGFDEAHVEAFAVADLDSEGTEASGRLFQSDNSCAVSSWPGLYV